MFELLCSFSWRELRHHPWRNAAAVVAVMLGVALAFSVHLINASALSEFSSAVRSVNGEPDLSLRATALGFDETLYGELAHHPSVAAISPVVELGTYALTPDGSRQPLRLLGVDALVVASVAPGLMPLPAATTEPGGVPTPPDPHALFAPDTVFLNASAMALLRPSGASDAGWPLRLQSGMKLRELRVAGTVAGSRDTRGPEAGTNAGTATGVKAGASADASASNANPPLAVMDIAAAQELFGTLGQISRMDVRLQPGADRAAFLRDAETLAGFAGQVTVAEPGDASQRIGALSRAYRVNLTVLALVALFTGAFLVFSVLALSVAKRAQQFALLGVLGLTPRQRLRLVLAESLVLGGVGSLLGLALGAGLAALALKLLGGDLGGGYFPGVTPRLQWSSPAAVAYGLLGLLAAGLGGWWPARQAQQLPPAQTLKGLGLAASSGGGYRWVGLLLMALGAGLATLPPVGGIPLAAYLSVALILLGGVGALPAGISLVYNRLSAWASGRVLSMLAVERARRQRDTAAVAISGVVASLSLAVALTVMVTSFRESVTAWLDVVLPAGLYVRMATGGSAGESAYFEPSFVQNVAQLSGVRKLNSQRVTTLQLDPARPAVALIARNLDDPVGSLPLLASPLPLPATAQDGVAVYVSEAFAALYKVQPGQFFQPLHPGSQASQGSAAPVAKPGADAAPGLTLATARLFVAGIWRDYARQHGSIVMDQADFIRLTGDRRVNDLALWLRDDADPARLQRSIRDLAEQRSGGGGAASQLLEFASAAQIRAASLAIFDRSFAVTYWLQAVAIAIGLFGVAASFSAQVLARRKEFGLLTHLGLTRSQILAVVASEGLVWTLIGAIAGLLLGLAVALVLVEVVNPQSFHWTMDLALPWLRLAALCAAVVLAGTLTAWLAGRAAASKDAVLAVKEDW